MVRTRRQGRRWAPNFKQRHYPSPRPLAANPELWLPQLPSNFEAHAIAFATVTVKETPSADRPLVFVSYSQKDEVWKDRVVEHLRNYELDDRLGGPPDQGGRRLVCANNGGTAADALRRLPDFRRARGGPKKRCSTLPLTALAMHCAIRRIALWTHPPLSVGRT
jgi:hypothetical protein